MRMCRYFYMFFLVIALESFIGYGGAAAQDASQLIPQFKDVSEEAGIDFIHSIGDDQLSNIIESTGAGCAFLDYDGDGDQDIYLVNGAYMPGLSHIRGRQMQGKLKNRLYRNEGGGKFTDVTESAGVGDTGFGMACVAVDYDNDGDTDLFVTNYGSVVLYQNQGDGTFQDVTQQAGLQDELWAIGACFFDYDRDGFLDLYVGHYLTYDPNYTYYYAADQFPGPLAYTGQPDTLYRNRGDGTFEDVTQKAGVYNPDGRAMGVAACDIDDDGHIDLFVANDAMENYFYQNNGDGTFTNIALQTATAFGQNGEATSAMGPEFGDFDLDGLMDLLVPDMNYSCLYHNTGQGYFIDQSAEKGIANACGQYTSWSGNFLDIDNDGDLDMFITNGNSHRLEGEKDTLILNEGGVNFMDVSARCGDDFQEELVGRGSAVADFDDDGDLDILVLNLNAPARLLRNDIESQNRWIKIKTIGTKSNRDGIGTRIRLTVGGVTQIRDIISSSGYLSQSAMLAHFGLGEHESVERIELRWPSGIVQILENVKSNQTLVVTEPESKEEE